jgi:hypothetical protein
MQSAFFQVYQRSSYRQNTVRSFMQLAGNIWDVKSIPQIACLSFLSDRGHSHDVRDAPYYVMEQGFH